MDQCTRLPLQLLPVVWNKEQRYTLLQEFQPGLQAATRETEFALSVHFVLGRVPLCLLF